MLPLRASWLCGMCAAMLPLPLMGMLGSWSAGLGVVFVVVLPCQPHAIWPRRGSSAMPKGGVAASGAAVVGLPCCKLLAADCSRAWLP